MVGHSSGTSGGGFPRRLWRSLLGAKEVPQDGLRLRSGDRPPADSSAFLGRSCQSGGRGAEGIPVAWSNQAAGGAWGEVAALDGFSKIPYQIAPVPLHCFYRYCFPKGPRAAL